MSETIQNLFLAVATKLDDCKAEEYSDSTIYGNLLEAWKSVDEMMSKLGTFNTAFSAVLIPATALLVNNWWEGLGGPGDNKLDLAACNFKNRLLNPEWQIEGVLIDSIEEGVLVSICTTDCFRRRKLEIDFTLNYNYAHTTIFLNKRRKELIDSLLDVENKAEYLEVRLHL
jgi:hypothetical protein